MYLPKSNLVWSKRTYSGISTRCQDVSLCVEVIYTAPAKATNCCPAPHIFFNYYFLCGLSGYRFAFFFKRTIKAFQPDVETCRAIAFRRHTAYKRLLCLLLWRLSLTIRYTSWDWRPYYFRRRALLRSCNPMSWHATLTPKVAYHLYHSVISAANCNIMLVSGGYTDYRFFMRYQKAIYLF